MAGHDRASARLFFKSHATDEVIDTPIDGKRRVHEWERLDTGLLLCLHMQRPHDEGGEEEGESSEGRKDIPIASPPI